MANQYPSGYSSVPVSGGLINSPHSFTGSPGPMSGVIGQGMGNMSSGMVMQGMQGMNPNMQSSMNQNMANGMNPNMAGSMNSNLANALNPNMNAGMTNGMNTGMGGGMSGLGGMSPSMNSVLSSGLGGPMGQGMPSQLSGQLTSPLSSSMSPGMGNMQHSMTNMQSGMSGNMTPNLSNGMTSGIVTGMSPMPMQYSMATSQPQMQQTNSSLGQPNTPSVTPTSVNCEGNSNVSGSVASGRLSATGDGSVATPSRDINTASLCRIGQETVQDIISRTQEIFNSLKTTQVPNGTAAGANAANEKKLKIQEQLRTIRILFKRLRLIYEKCNDNSQLQGMEYTHIESLIPIKDEWDGKSEERKNSESYRQATEEHRELLDAVVTKNRTLKDVIDHMRRIIWEINTMLMMRRS